MKLVDWMQHKFRQTNDEHLKEFTPIHELEKVLGVEDVGNDSARRSSHSSTITLSGKPLDGAVDCPLQGYLFGLPETTTVKERTTSLGDLFQKTKIVEEKQKKKETDKSAVYLMKKKTKKKNHSLFV